MTKGMGEQALQKRIIWQMVQRPWEKLGKFLKICTTCNNHAGGVECKMKNIANYHETVRGLKCFWHFNLVTLRTSIVLETRNSVF